MSAIQQLDLMLTLAAAAGAVTFLLCLVLGGKA